MFKTRLLSGIVLVIIAFATIFLGGDVLFATLLIISLIGVSELYKVVKIEKAPLGIVGYIGVVAYYFLIRAQKKEDLMICLLYTSPSPRDPKTSRMPSSA